MLGEYGGNRCTARGHTPSYCVPPTRSSLSSAYGDQCGPDLLGFSILISHRSKCRPLTGVAKTALHTLPWTYLSRTGSAASRHRKDVRMMYDRHLIAECRLDNRRRAFTRRASGGVHE